MHVHTKTITTLTFVYASQNAFGLTTDGRAAQRSGPE